MNTEAKPPLRPWTDFSMGRIIAFTLCASALMGAAAGILHIILAQWFGSDSGFWLNIPTGAMPVLALYSVPLLRAFRRDRWLLRPELRRNLGERPKDIPSI